MGSCFISSEGASPQPSFIAHLVGVTEISSIPFLLYVQFHQNLPQSRSRSFNPRLHIPPTARYRVQRRSFIVRGEVRHASSKDAMEPIIFLEAIVAPI